MNESVLVLSNNDKIIFENKENISLHFYNGLEFFSEDFQKNDLKKLRDRIDMILNK